MTVEQRRHEVHITETPDHRRVVEDTQITDTGVTEPLPIVQEVVEVSTPPRQHDGVIITETPTHQVRQELHVTHMDGYDRRERVTRDTSVGWRVFLARLSAVIWLAFDIIVGLIAFRLVLTLLGANPTNTFAAFIYNLSAVFMAPFNNLTRSPAIGNGALDVPAIIAMIVYLIVAFLIVRVLRVLFAPSSRIAVRRRVETLRRQA